MRYFIELSFNGTNYHGWQIQPDAISVQEKVNEAISKITRQKINVVAAGRTDTGVHASQMFVHFDSEQTIENNTFLYKVNSVLPEDIVAKKILQVRDDAHTRFDATSRSYTYQIFLGRNPFLLETTWQLHHTELDIQKMNTACNLLFEYTDFKCFSRSKSDVHTYNCTITKAEWNKKGNMLVFEISANRFLRNMVRAIVGTLVAVGQEKIDIEDFKKIIESKNRSNAGTSAPAKGLSLTAIEYPETIYHE